MIGGNLKQTIVLGGQAGDLQAGDRHRSIVDDDDGSGLANGFKRDDGHSGTFRTCSLLICWFRVTSSDRINFMKRRIDRRIDTIRSVTIPSQVPTDRSVRSQTFDC